ncbi:F0F1 ATP synthase subunit delta [Hyphococcus luteus]|uniref:ATP synthase subunit b n=1 Tax=Hyphococcus luteus TaxID=2058213 RepID=A0A2S7KAM4_9PROT|nr:F0F1 ATP synthase subunit delta [Marinicaulis flavus]PQA89570.1 hypothetical protein CW354_01490 [Marinicaulis flavus]
MEINWVTVAAQIVNFLVLVWLLKRFLYGPVTRAMERRQKRVRDRLQEAESMRGKAEQERDALKAERDALDRKREEMLSEARAAADKLRHELEKQTRESVDAERAAWFARLSGDRQEVLSDIRRRAGEEFFAIARAAFRDLADDRLEARMIAAFAEKLRALPEETLEKLKSAVRRETSSAQIESAFPLEAEDREAIELALKDILQADVSADYVQREDLIAGIRLRLDSQVVEWGLDSYLDELEERLGTALSDAGVAEAKKAAE